MNLSAFQDLQFDDEEEMQGFRLALQVNHEKIAQVLFGSSLFYKTYPLIDSEPHNKDWQQNLQQELSSIFSLLDMTGLPDLSGTDLGREDDFNEFMQLLVFTEQRINARLGIT